MKYRVVISDEVLEEVESFLDFLDEQFQEPEIAIRWWEKSLEKISTLTIMPRRCPYAPQNEGTELELRVLIVGNGLFMFHVDDETHTVHVVEFRHARRAE